MKLQIILACGLGLALLAPLGSAQNSKPNVIFILADDLGYGDLGCFGQKYIRTPHIDSLATEGIKLTSYYSGQTVCSPSRASLMYGQHMGHSPIKTNSGKSPQKGDFLLPQLFKKAGYTTGMIGKWGLMGRSWDETKFDAYHYPNNCGFDYWFGFESQGYAHFYYPDRLLENKSFVQFPENVGIRKKGLYAPGKGKHAHDSFIEKAQQFIANNKDNPFFLYIPFATPHAELAVPSDCAHLAYYNSLGWKDPAKSEGGGGGAYGSEHTKGYSACIHPHATYAAMISRMDESIGKIKAQLKELKIDQKTLIIFTSDNGASGEGGQSMEFFNSSGPFRGFKRSIYEGGTRVPFVAKWPGYITADSSSEFPCGLNDVMVTMAEILKFKKPNTSDGISFLPTLLGDINRQTPMPYRYFLWRDSQAIRKGDWKLIENKSKSLELYNLKSDPGEKKNIMKQHPEKVTELIPLLEHATTPIDLTEG